jgi:hypothetical protein
MTNRVVIEAYLHNGCQCIQVHAYTSALPKSVDIPLFWAADELSIIANTRLRRKVQEQRVKWEGWHAGLLAAKPDCPITKDELFWALSCVGSRTFEGPYVGSTIKACLLHLMERCDVSICVPFPCTPISSPRTFCAGCHCSVT